MDVSCVFNKKDNHYFTFKSEIKTKENIREHLNNVDQSQNDSSTKVNSNGGTGSSDPDSMAAASSGAYGPGIN